MSKISRKEIQIISRYSNWSEGGIKSFLQQHVYSGPNQWKGFLSLLFLGLGVSFLVAGIIFFFAYNWADLHKFVKIGLVEGLVIITVLVALFSKWDKWVKNTVLTATSVLVGVLLAVFGQVYQTGANAYDLFLGWTLLITLWVIVVNFPPLWVVYIVLVNISFVLYGEQVAQDWSGGFMLLLLFCINLLFLLLFVLGDKDWDKLKVPRWFTNLLVFTTVAFGTIAITNAIFDDFRDTFHGISVLLISVFFGLGVWYGLKIKRLIYLSLIPFGVIIIIAALLVEASDGAAMFFTVSLFIVISVTLLIKNLINLQKKWRN